MGAGLSMASVNKIKELANSKEYSLALDIVDSQDLSKSLNPQFLRLCGEIYTETGRYKDARKTLLMAHRLAPEAKRILYSLVYLYLKTGYYDLAKTYYDIYLFDAGAENEETNQLKYIYAKANGEPLENLLTYLDPYVHMLDYDWSYELYLLYVLLGKKEAEALYEDYQATYKNTDNSRKMRQIRDKETDANEAFSIFAKEKVPDDDPEQEELREEESKLLEADDLRIHPREPEITIMVDDLEGSEVGSKRKIKKFLKEQERQQRKEEKAAEEALKQEEEQSQQEPSEEELSEDGKEKKGLFKGLFKKKKQEDEPDAGTADTPENEPETDADTPENEPETEKEDSETGEKEAEPEEDKTDVEAKEAEEDKTNVETKEAEPIPPDESEPPQSEEAAEEKLHKMISEKDQEEISEKTAEPAPDDEELDMREIHLKSQDSKIETVVSIDFDDDFTAESDTIEGLKEHTEKSPDIVSETKEEETQPVPKKKFLFEDAELAPLDGDEEEFQPDDFSIKPDDAFGVMADAENATVNTEDIKPEIYDTEPEETEPGTENEISADEEIEIPENFDREDEVTVSAAWEEETEPEVDDTEPEEMEPEPEEAESETSDLEPEEMEPDTENEISADEEIEISEDFDREDEVTVSAAWEEETEPETYDAEPEEMEPEPEEAESETYDTEPEEMEPEEAEPETYDTEPEEMEPDTENEISADEEIEISEDFDREDEVTVSAAWEEETEPEAYDAELETYDLQPEEAEPEIEETEPVIPAKKDKLDFPIFRSSLFPTYNTETHEVENNFNEIMSSAQGKMHENMMKEEQMQKEAEDLLASLGIDLGDIVVTADSYDGLNAALYEGPSRDELKASLKIDSVKKDILRKLKEDR